MANWTKDKLKYTNTIFLPDLKDARGLVINVAYIHNEQARKKLHLHPYKTYAETLFISYPEWLQLK